MTLDELQQLIMASRVDDWYVAPYGPTYLPPVGPFATRTSHHLGVREHAGRATYVHDVSIGIAYGLDLDDGDRELDFGWNRSLPNPLVSRTLCDIFCYGMLVDRRTQLDVDGGRAVLPLDEGAIGLPGHGPTRYYAPRFDVQLARLVHCLSGLAPHTFDEYLARTGITDERERVAHSRLHALQTPTPAHQRL